jgi:hypothetical protein
MGKLGGRDLGGNEVGFIDVFSGCVVEKLLTDQARLSGTLAPDVSCGRL